jgi:diaminohydroxyphosphoribosylaminopyrimidine deaminase/5-amino-6-(5-phosphoribosylamino)uracil reductase
MSDHQWMFRALELAALGQGAVEPNPMVGCVLVKESRIIAEGWHRRFGDLHAEAEALQNCSGDPRGSTAYVTLEPCCHTGKQPPCTAALIHAGVERVVVAMPDPFAEVNGGGFDLLKDAGIRVEVGLLQEQARELNAPYLKLVQQGRPWVLGKWAATLDGKIATSQGDSRWISNTASRSIVHQIRGRCDAIVVGSGTARVDDPLLTVRPPGPRTPVRVVVNSEATLDIDSQLVRTIEQAPVWVVCGPDAEPGRCDRLRELGVDVVQFEERDPNARLLALLDTMGQARMTNVLIEGGAHLMGSLFDLQMIDEIHAFIAPKLVGGVSAPGPIGGGGVGMMPNARQLQNVSMEPVEGDLYCHGRVRYTF